MYRRVLSLLLLPCVVLTQSAGLGHCHSGNEPPGHDLRPHFHTNPISFFYSHDHHRHGRDGHQHHEGDHDSDAVYITSLDLVISERSAVDDELAVLPLGATSGLNSANAFWVNPPQEVASWTQPPPPTGRSCPLYVSHLTLLL